LKSPATTSTSASSLEAASTPWMLFSCHRVGLLLVRLLVCLWEKSLTIPVLLLCDCLFACERNRVLVPVMLLQLMRFDVSLCLKSRCDPGAVVTAVGAICCIAMRWIAFGPGAVVASGAIARIAIPEIDPDPGAVITTVRCDCLFCFARNRFLLFIRCARARIRWNFFTSLSNSRLSCWSDYKTYWAVFHLEKEVFLLGCADSNSRLRVLLYH
jgi:hypothetical protein